MVCVVLKIKCSGGSKGAPLARVHPPTDLNFLNFIQFFGKSGISVCWRPLPGELAPPPTGFLDPPLK